MKTMTRLALLTLSIVVPVLAFSQPPPGEEPHPGDFPPPGPPSLPGEGAPPRGEPGFRPQSPLHRWMQDLKDNDPEEFRRLQELRINDPAAFRAVTREKMQQQAMARLRKERPSIHEAIMNLSPEDRAWLADRLLRPPAGGGPKALRPHSMPDEDPRGPDRPPEIDRSLIRAYHRTENPEEKTRLREELRRQLDASYDRHTELRRAQLAEAEEKLAAIRNAIEQGEQGKEAFIEKKISAWLDQPSAGRKSPE